MPTLLALLKKLKLTNRQQTLLAVDKKRIAAACFRFVSFKNNLYENL